MSYTVLARRYRSRDFDEVVGQEPIARTLQTAIDTDRLAHAYLFCGTRGVGKTSMARIFAWAINVKSDDALTQTDAITEAIFRGDDLDVIEIDGASNRGINEARDLIAGAELSPTRCRYKVYIIDEVHMLTREAFNVLLKTMEEPPDHVKFILCTTEPHKVPATIQSRCQRFDFRSLSTALIADHLRAILKKEKLKAEDAVVVEVAKLANGSMRDALSLMDRLLAAGDKKLTLKLLEDMLGLPDQTLVMNLVDAISGGRPDDTLEAGEALLRSGTSIEQSLSVLIEYLRTLMLISACGEDSALVELSEDARERAASQAASFDTPALVHMIAMCDAVYSKLQSASSARALLDALLVRLALTEHLADLPSLLDGRQTGAATPSASEGAAKSQASQKKKPSMSRS